MVTREPKKRISIQIATTTCERLAICQREVSRRTGLPVISLSNVTALAIEEGLRILEAAAEQTPTA